MKTRKIIFAGIMICLLALSALGRNNFNIGWNLLDDETKTYTEKEVLELVGLELIKPIKECYEEAYPHAFMTKCYSEIRFKFDRHSDWQPTDGEERVFYESERILGNAVYTECGMDQHIGKVEVNMGSKSIKVQESFFSDWVSADEFISSFCKRLDEQFTDE